jgi:hypothetical protein
VVTPGTGGQILLGQERHLFARAAQDEEVALEVDAALVPLQHVQPEQEVHVVVLQYLERRGEGGREGGREGGVRTRSQCMGGRDGWMEGRREGLP